MDLCTNSLYTQLWAIGRDHVNNIKVIYSLTIDIKVINTLNKSLTININVIYILTMNIKVIYSLTII